MMDRKDVDILLVEDDAGDVELARAGLKSAKVLVNLYTVDDGEKAMKYLRREPPYADAVMPDLVLLDLNLPRKDGREVLEEIKGDPKLRSIPVCVLTTSDSDMDITRCYDLGANCYITKPIRFEEFIKVIKTLEEFWCTIVKIPPKITG
jgi:two-component system response regulator